MKLRIVICTHNPNLSRLFMCFSSIRNQRGLEYCDVLIVDNGTSPTLQVEVERITKLFGYHYTSVPWANLTKARLLGIEYGELITPQFFLFVDDDNYLHPEYVEIGTKFLEKNSNVGAAAGKSEKSQQLLKSKNSWANKYLAIRDLGEETLISNTLDWEICDPHGAGLLLSYSAAETFLKFMKQTRHSVELGRSGNKLLSGEDTLICLLLKRNGLKTAYVPGLVLTHDVSAERFKLRYLARLASGMGKSDYQLARVLGDPEPGWLPMGILGQSRSLLYELELNGIFEALFKTIRNYSRKRESGKRN